ncbi:MAG: hypothetical protein N0E48_15950 [Candidatus Thiodiazotropha endolucinida]|nr:hypothetical protein [Candidatus Thiodiazotropha taylori]MCW4344824.1 hypothetical protein [Candidatus Thiodiazotropha endolucinida]
MTNSTMMPPCKMEGKAVIIRKAESDNDVNQKAESESKDEQMQKVTVDHQPDSADS